MYLGFKISVTIVWNVGDNGGDENANDNDLPSTSTITILYYALMNGAVYDMTSIGLLPSC